jgi:iron complex outermembrane receptor protein
LPVLAPGLNITNITGNSVIYMRGVGNNNSTAGQEQNIAMYVDGVYYPSMAADPGSFANVERIEVLKGPQGTLFGRNTTGGLIQIITKDPTQEVGGNASVGYGNFGTTDASAYITGGIATNLAADLSVDYHDQATGWGRNLDTGAEIDRTRSSDARSKWVFTPLDGTKITLTGAYTNIHTDVGTTGQVLTHTPLPPSFDSAVYPGSLYNINQNVNPYLTLGQTTASVRLDQNLGDIKFLSISAYQNSDRQAKLDLDSTPAAQLAAYSPNRTNSFSQEFQLSSSSDRGLNWAAGLLYFHMNGNETPLVILAGPTELAAASYNTGQKTNSVAGYGQATLPLNDSTNLTLGGRYTKDRQELYGTLTAFTGTGFVVEGVDPATNVTSFGDLTYKVALDHHFTDDLMGFVSVSTGFKSGVYNITFSAPNEAPVKPEKLTDYEVGMKSELFNRTVRLNLDAFYYNYKDLQLQSFTGDAIITLNAASAQVYGIEADFDTNITERLVFHAGASELHSEYKDFPDVPAYDTSATGLGVPITGLSGTGNQLMRTPELTFNVSLDYRVPVSFGELAANTTLYHTSSYYFEPDDRLYQGAYNLVNGQLSWKSLGDRYNVRLWAKNLFNQQYYIAKISGNDAPDAGYPAPPRTYGVSIGMKF